MKPCLVLYIEGDQKLRAYKVKGSALLFWCSLLFFPTYPQFSIQTFCSVPVIPKPNSRSADVHDTHFEDSMKPVPTEQAYDILNANYAFLDVKPKLVDETSPETLTMSCKDVFL